MIAGKGCRDGVGHPDQDASPGGTCGGESDAPKGQRDTARSGASGEGNDDARAAMQGSKGDRHADTERKRINRQ